MTLNHFVLVLNQNYQPLNVCRARRAMTLIARETAEALQDSQGYIRTTSQRFKIPSVIRLFSLVRRPMIQRRLSRRGVFIRDGFTCQYCGGEMRDLTLDHVIPRFRSGQHSWDNVVSACTACNHRKAGKTPREAGMRLLSIPQPPKPNPYQQFNQYHIPEEWEQFMPWAIRTRDPDSV